MNEHYKAKARKHWARWLPRKVAALRAAGELEAALQVAANNARARVDELMAMGWQLHEAEEVANAEFLLLKPEPQAALEDWERAELAASEREYQTMMRAFLGLDDPEPDAPATPPPGARRT
jgi:hypothetical protein